MRFGKKLKIVIQKIILVCDMTHGFCGGGVQSTKVVRTTYIFHMCQGMKVQRSEGRGKKSSQGNFKIPHEVLFCL